ncbi:MAG: hypothetical protein AB8C84_06130 [Oligoflexales bacterium]
MKNPVSMQTFFRMLKNPDLDFPPVSRFLLSDFSEKEEESEEGQEESL